MTGVLPSIPAPSSGSMPAVLVDEELPSYDDARTSRLRRTTQVRFATSVNIATSRAATIESRRPDPYISERSFHIRTTKGTPWLTMTLRSRATSAKYLPLYCDRDVIRGSVTLDLQDSLRLTAIVLKYRCVISGEIQQVILDKEHSIWPPTDDPRTSFIPRGKHVLPIDFPIPREALNPRRPGEMVDLPPTFIEGDGRAVYIDYTLSVTLRKRGLNISRKITTGIGYYPRSVCGASSLLRSLAYENNTSLLGPELDPSGWKILQSVRVELPSTTLGTKTSLAEHTLAVAVPVSFAIGGSIPVFLTIKSLESQTLDIAASRVNVQLRRVVRVGRRDTSCKHIARAIFYPYEQSGLSNEEGIRLLQGEISIPKGTTPSFTWLDVALLYDLALYSPSIAEPSAPAFVSDGGKLLLSERIIVTAASPRLDVVSLSSPPPAYGS